MKKLKLDPLENEFSRLNDFEDFADDSIWQGINEGLNKEDKKNKKIVLWIFGISIVILSISIGWYKFLGNNIVDSISFNQKKHQKLTINNTTISKNNNVENNFKLDHNSTLVGEKIQNKTEIKVLHFVNLTNNENSMLKNSTNFNCIFNETETLNIFGHRKINTKENKFTYEFENIDKIKRVLKETLQKKSLCGIDVFVGKSLIFNSDRYNLGNNSNFGVNFSQSKIKYLTLSIGLSIESYQLKGKSYTDQPNRYIKDSILAINHKREIFYYKFYDTAINTSSTHFKRQVFQIALPIGIRYTVFEKNKFNVELKGEAVLSYNLSKKEVFSSTKGNKLLTTKYEDFNQFLHKANFRMGTGVRFNYNVFKQNTVFISPTVSYALGAMKNTLTKNTVSPFIIGIQAGFCIKF